MSRKYVPEILALASTPLMFPRSILVGRLYAYELIRSYWSLPFNRAAYKATKDYTGLPP
jgi:hypothetical protein